MGILKQWLVSKQHFFSQEKQFVFCIFDTREVFWAFSIFGESAGGSVFDE